MLISLTTSHRPATDLGYLLRKNPARVHSFELPFGQAHVFFPEASDARCTASLLVDVDPVGLVRRPKGAGGPDSSLYQYVNDRPYAASSFLSVAIGRVFGSAMSGVSKERPELADQQLPLQLEIPALPCRGGEDLLRRLFGPLGYSLRASARLLDENFADWGTSRYLSVELAGSFRVRDLLQHIYVLLPVLDDQKHYWVGEDEISKLLRRGGDWLAGHPEKELITSRYLKHRKSLTRTALARLIEEENDEEAADEREDANAREEIDIERPIGLHEQRLNAVIAALKSVGARSVADLGCGEGKLLAKLMADRSFEQIVGLEVSARALALVPRRLRLERLPERQRRRLTLLQGSLLYGDARLKGHDAATLVEVIEHIEPGRLPALERAVFGIARPGSVIVTTPNIEFNARFEGLREGGLRHRDHRFEWTRAEFEAWANRVGGTYGYRVRFVGIGDVDAEFGPPTQMAVFTS